MQGLRTDVGSKIEKFWELVQTEASKRQSVFFLDTEEGKTFEDPNLGLEAINASGWLIPNDKVADFEPAFLRWDDLPDKWDVFEGFVDFDVFGGKLLVKVKLLTEL